MKQSPRLWNDTFKNVMTKIGFEQSESDPCLFIERNEPQYLLLYVDDILLFSKSIKSIVETKNKLKSHFAITDLGEIQKFLGISVIRNRSAKMLTIHQADHIRNILTQFQMTECKGISTPMEPVRNRFDDTPDNEITQEYQKLVGSLIYLSVTTRIDIAFSVMYLTRHMHAPSREHLTMAKRVLRYLQTTQELGITYYSKDQIIGYSDADWASDWKDRKSISGYVFIIGGGAVSWKSKKHR